MSSIATLSAQKITRYPRSFITFLKDAVGVILAFLVFLVNSFFDLIKALLVFFVFMKEQLWWSFVRRGYRAKWIVLLLVFMILAIYAVGYDTVLYMFERSKVFEKVNISPVYAAGTADPILAEEAMLLTDVSDNGVFTYYTYYTVKKGDTPAGIAKRFGIKVETLLWANKLSRYSRLKVGQRLKVPLADGVLHTVKKGETLEQIAKRYKSTVADILEANWLDSPTDIKPGMEIFVPEGTLPTEQLQQLAQRLRTSTRVSYGTARKSPVRSKCGGLPQFLTVWPVEGPSRFSRGSTRFHTAWDIISSTSNKHPYILAAGSGRVVFAGVDGCGYRRTRRCGYAWRIDIDHGNGYITRYAHLKAGSLLVRVGQYVKAGQRIAQMGDTGWATGIHLHFEVRRVGGNRLNPACFFK